MLVPRSKDYRSVCLPLPYRRWFVVTHYDLSARLGECRFFVWNVTQCVQSSWKQSVVTTLWSSDTLQSVATNFGWARTERKMKVSFSWIMMQALKHYARQMHILKWSNVEKWKKKCKNFKMVTLRSIWEWKESRIIGYTFVSELRIRRLLVFLQM